MIVWVSVTITVLALAVGVGSTLFWGKDNPVEEVCEEVIKEMTGREIDLSPELTKEEKVYEDANDQEKETIRRV